MKKYALKTGLDLWDLEKYKSSVKKTLYRKIEKKLQRM